ncbi:MAG: hypothetical protein K2F96_02910 [Muribaculaceae bacterium]|nr:hypothetical protein [Muribaculaceae bacterium]
MIKSIVKLLMSPRRASISPGHREHPLIILGNGPSLAQTLEHSHVALTKNPLLPDGRKFHLQTIVTPDYTLTTALPTV